jgi:hypothetical protein
MHLYSEPNFLQEPPMQGSRFLQGKRMATALEARRMRQTAVCRD